MSAPGVYSPSDQLISFAVVSEESISRRRDVVVHRDLLADADLPGKLAQHEGGPCAWQFWKCV